VSKHIDLLSLQKNILAVLSGMLFTISSVGLYQSINFHHLNNTDNKVLGIEDQKDIVGFPIRLIIPALNINTGIQYLGSTEGEMDVPNNSTDVGWFMLGPRPGENGSAVIAGHLNEKKGGDGVFANLNKLKTGDKLYIEDSNKKIHSFAVRESRLYDPGFADEVFVPNGSPYLNLVTCEGVWDRNKKIYSKRLVVFADIISQR